MQCAVPVTLLITFCDNVCNLMFALCSNITAFAYRLLQHSALPILSTKTKMVSIFNRCYCSSVGGIDGVFGEHLYDASFLSDVTLLLL